MSEYAIIPGLLEMQPSTVLRVAEMAFIPFDPDNTDYQTYLAWVEDGNVAEPWVAPEPAPEEFPET